MLHFGKALRWAVAWPVALCSSHLCGSAFLCRCSRSSWRNDSYDSCQKGTSLEIRIIALTKLEILELLCFMMFYMFYGFYVLTKAWTVWRDPCAAENKQTESVFPQRGTMCHSLILFKDIRCSHYCRLRRLCHYFARAARWRCETYH